MTSDDLCYLSAYELRNLYLKRELSPVEVTKALLRRIERLNPVFNPYVTVTHEHALEQAIRAERAYMAGNAGTLAGIPGSLKDLTPTKGILTARGSLLYMNWVPDYDAPLAERLDDAGMVLLGKTTTPELGWKGDSGNRVNGPVHNPWKYGRTAGGSSGGAAAAVALGLGPIAQGTDGAGSIRIPCGFCGLYGLKPSWGRVPQYPASVVELLSHAGPIARTVKDAAMMLTAMAGAHPMDRLSLPDTTDYLSEMEGDIDGLRIAWSPDLGYARIDPDVQRVAAAAAARFQELGCHVEEAHPGLPDPWDLADTIWAASFAGVFKDNLNEVRDLLDAGLVAVIDRGRGVSGAELATAYARRNDYYHGWREFMEAYDLFLSPTLPVTAFTAGNDHPGDIAGHPTSYLGWTAFTYPFNVTGQPAATVPAGFAGDGLPVGLQIVGRWRDDAGVLRASAALETIAPWTETRPAT